MMKKHSMLMVPIVMPVFAGLIYTPLNNALLVGMFGCGCKIEGINANHITTLVFLFVLLACMVGTFALSRRLLGWKRWTYLAAGIMAELFLCSSGMLLNIWL